MCVCVQSRVRLYTLAFTEFVLLWARANSIACAVHINQWKDHIISSQLLSFYKRNVSKTRHFQFSSDANYNHIIHIQRSLGAQSIGSRGCSANCKRDRCRCRTANDQIHSIQLVHVFSSTWYYYFNFIVMLNWMQPTLILSILTTENGTRIPTHERIAV